MDDSRFDQLARRMARGVSRRHVLKTTLVPGAVGLGLFAVPTAPEVAANHNKKCLKSGKLCGKFARGKTTKCCKDDQLLCKEALNASNSDTTCCGGEGAKCGGDNEDFDDLKPYCCQGYICSTDGQGTSTPGKCKRQPPAD